MIDKLEQIALIKKLNQHKPMPIIWWTCLVLVLPLLCSLLGIQTVWRVGLLFGVFNCVVSYQVGKLIKTLTLKPYWLFFFTNLFLFTSIIKVCKIQSVIWTNLSNF